MVLAEPLSPVREAVLSACERVLARIGYRRMTMTDVADEARLARRTLYLHFSSKDDLVAATLSRVIARTRTAMQEALAIKPGIDALRVMLNARIQSRLEQVGPFHHAIDEVLQAIYPHSSEDYSSFFQPETDMVAAALKKGMADGSVMKTSAQETAELLVRATNGFLPSNLSQAEAADRSMVAKKVTALVDLLTCGLAGERR